MPFAYELRTLLDWTCAATALTWYQWLKLEDVRAALYLEQCRLHFRRNRRVRRCMCVCVCLCVFVCVLAEGRCFLCVSHGTLSARFQGQARVQRVLIRIRRPSFVC